MILENINNSCILYTNEQVIHTREYYNYCVDILRQSVINRNINIIFGNYYYEFNNNNKTIKIDIQCEHTLVKEGGRGSEGSPKGKIPNKDDFYLVRISNLSYLSTLDIIIEYSLPNIENIKTVSIYEEFLSKIAYISPVIYDYTPNEITNRNINCITLFSNIHEPRRNKLLHNISLLKINSININNCFSKKDICELYSQTKLLLNIRQTEHHDTFEELRVLPALLNGVIVISENVPLKESIPYSDYIIWTEYDSVLDVMIEVQNNYEYYWNRIFSDGKLKSILEKIKNDNIQTINIFLDIMCNESTF